MSDGTPLPNQTGFYIAGTSAPDREGQLDDSEPTPERQAELRAAYEANTTAGNAPYAGEAIRTRGELSWVIRERGWSVMPFELKKVPRANFSNVIFASATLSTTQLSEADLTGADLFETNLSGSYLIDTNFSDTYMQQTNLSGAQLLGADLSHARLSQVDLHGADLTGVNLSASYLSGVNLSSAILRGANLSSAFLREVDLTGADLREARMTLETSLVGAPFDTSSLFADVVWNGAPLARVEWDALPVFGDELRARKRSSASGQKKNPSTRLHEYQAAVRAYQLLAVALKGQGLNEHADRYAYRAQLMQRVVLLRQASLRGKDTHVSLLQRFRKLSAYFGSWFLDVIAGYGYKPGRSIVTYFLLVGGFAVAYYLLGVPPSHADASYHLQWYEALVISLTAFHGRGFFAGQYSPGDPQSVIAAIEAVLGLLLEISFIATFTQRFFAR